MSEAKAGGEILLHRKGMEGPAFLVLDRREQNEESPEDFVFEAFEKRRLPTLPLGVAVPSALVSLTSLFGMGRGGSSPL